MKIASLFLVAMLAVGCPPASQKKEQTNDVCARVGQTCEVSPGKLGTCVAKDGCTEPSPACFTCQSQH